MAEKAAAAAPPRRSEARHHLRPGGPLAVSIEVPSVSADMAEMLRTVEERPARRPCCATRRCASRRRRSRWTTRSTPSSSHAIASSSWLKRASSNRRRPRCATRRREGSRRAHPRADHRRGHRCTGRELAGSVLGFRRARRAGQGRPGAGARHGSPGASGGRAHGLLTRAASSSSRARVRATLQGYDFTLAIDEASSTSRSRLDAAMRTYETKASSSSSTGHRRGSASLADAPTQPQRPSPSSRLDRPAGVTDRFEPGSVMKSFMLAAPLNAGTVKAH